MPSQRFGVDAGQHLTLYFGTEDEPSTLHLTYDEAGRLASWVRQEIAHGFEGEEHSGTINVADVLCDYREARDLLFFIELGLGPDDELADDQELPRGRGDVVDWRKEGF
jgi:hypothetical protein